MDWLPNEEEVWTGFPYKGDMDVKKKSVLRYVGIILLILFIELPLASFLFVFFRTSGLIIGIIIILLTIIFGFKPKSLGKPSGGLIYTITNQRALITIVDRKEETISKSCQLQGCDVVTQNITNHNVTNSDPNPYYGRRGIQYSSTGEDFEVGDVIFLKNGTKQLIFTDVRDPKGVKEIALKIIDQLNLGSSPY